MIRYIGDVHGKFDQYMEIVKDCEYSIQLGDFGFGKEWTKLYYSGLDPVRHKVCSGNHDDMMAVQHSPHWLGDFGEFSLNGRDMFFVRGGLSIDRVYRIGEQLGGSCKSWWSSEELDFEFLYRAFLQYKEVKPEIMISHVAPISVKDHLVGSNKKPNTLQRYGFDLGFEENTSIMLDMCFRYHKPKLWLFGHYHNSMDKIINGCRCICLAELEYKDL